MKAFLLAAGKGTRLLPLTLDTPKCLIPVSGRPLIEYWFDLFKIYGIDEILMNTSHLAEKVRDYINGNPRDFRIELVHEENLLGSGGTIKKNWAFVDGEEPFFIFYADNFTNINLKNMLDFHYRKKKDFTLAVFNVPNPKECGIVELDKDSTVISFTEKPDNPTSSLAFAGVMVSTRKLKGFLPDRDFFDLGYDVLPCLVGRAAGYILEDYLLDVGTPEKLKLAEQDVKKNIFRFTRNIKI